MVKLTSFSVLIWCLGKKPELPHFCSVLVANLGCVRRYSCAQLILGLQPPFMEKRIIGPKTDTEWTVKHFQRVYWCGLVIQSEASGEALDFKLLFPMSVKRQRFYLPWKGLLEVAR